MAHTITALMALAEASPTRCKTWTPKSKTWALGVALSRREAWCNWYATGGDEEDDDHDRDTTGFAIAHRDGLRRVERIVSLDDPAAIRAMLRVAHIPVVDDRA